MERTLSIQNKIGFIDGILTQPTDPTDPLRIHWKQCNDMVITWI